MDGALALLATPVMGKAFWLWLTFAGIVIGLLAFDLGVLNRDDHVIGLRESLLLSGGYVSVALLFGAGVWWQLGAASGIAYLTGFLIEKSLSIDNVFVIALIFSYLAIPARFQHRVLFWGIVGVLVLRAIVIALGAALISQFSRSSASLVGCCTCLVRSWCSRASRCGERPIKCRMWQAIRCWHFCAGTCVRPPR